MNSPRTLKFVIAILIAYGILFTFLNVDQREYIESQEIDNKRILKKLEHKEDSLNLAAKELQAERLLAIKEMQKVTQEANMKVAKAEKIIYEYSKIKPVVSRNDAERDSLLSAVLN